ncbi:hypothetical protein NKH77_03920 [Streptomyces sp. M19]
MAVRSFLLGRLGGVGRVAGRGAVRRGGGAGRPVLGAWPGPVDALVRCGRGAVRTRPVAGVRIGRGARCRAVAVSTRRHRDMVPRRRRDGWRSAEVAGSGRSGARNTGPTGTRRGRPTRLK